MSKTYSSYSDFPTDYCLICGAKLLSYPTNPTSGENMIAYNCNNLSVKTGNRFYDYVNYTDKSYVGMVIDKYKVIFNFNENTTQLSIYDSRINNFTNTVLIESIIPLNLDTFSRSFETLINFQ